VLKAPDEPMPEFREPEAPPAVSPCQSLSSNTRWLDPTRPAQRVSEASGDFAFAELSPGSRLEFRFLVEQPSLGGEIVDHEIGLLADAGIPFGWILSFSPESGSWTHGNTMEGGRYTGRAFKASFKRGEWNQGRLDWCRDGRLRLTLNGEELARAIPASGSLLSFRVRALGAKVTVSK
jgi:hypothetical protein